MAVSLVVCLAIAVVAVLHGELAPVGQSGPDLFWTVLLAGVASVVTLRAPLWLVTIGAFAVVGFASTVAGISAAVAAVAIAIFGVHRSGWSHSAWQVFRGPRLTDALLMPTLAGSLFAASLSLQDHGIPFSSAIVAFVLWTAIAVGAFFMLPRRPKAIVGSLAAALSLAAIAVLFATAVELQTARAAAIATEHELRATVDIVRSGDIEGAEQSVRRAAIELNQAEMSFDSAAISLASRAPVFGQNLSAVREALDGASNVLDSAQSAVGSGRNFDQAFTEDGLDLDAVMDVAFDAEKLLADTVALHNTVEKDREIWVLNQLTQQFDSVAERTAPAEDLAALPLFEGVEQLLGSDEPRSYLLVFGNTAEARELGGFAGGTALVTVDDGQITLERADRPRDLNRSPTDPSVFSTPQPQRFLQHNPWLFSQNFTGMADFPTLAQSLGDLYPHMGGAAIDGVAYLDPEALAAFIGLVGAVELPEENIVVTADTVVPLLTIDQYEIHDIDNQREPRERFLDELVASTFEKLLALDTPLDLEQLTPIVNAVREDRLLFVPFGDDELEVMNALGVTGGINAQPGADYLAVSHVNGGPNKLDAYMHRSINYRADIDPTTGALRAVVEITLRNRAPGGLSSYASSNRSNYPSGTNRSFVVVHTPHDAVEWIGGDEPELTRSWSEFGLQRHEVVVAVPSGESRTVTLVLEGSITPGDYRLDVGHQPLLTDDSVTLSISPQSGEFSSLDSEVTYEGERLEQQFRLTQDTAIDLSWSPEDSRTPARSLGDASN